MPAYDDQHFNPPAPVATIELVSVEGSPRASSGVPVLIDTGADFTLLPGAAVRALGVEVLAESYSLEGFDGRRSEAAAAQLAIRFLGRTFRGRFLLIDQPIGVLGRNVLDHVHITLDGPSRQWHEVVAP